MSFHDITDIIQPYLKSAWNGPSFDTNFQKDIPRFFANT